MDPHQCFCPLPQGPPVELHIGCDHVQSYAVCCEYRLGRTLAMYWDRHFAVCVDNLPVRRHVPSHSIDFGPWGVIEDANPQRHVLASADLTSIGIHRSPALVYGVIGPAMVSCPPASPCASATQSACTRTVRRRNGTWGPHAGSPAIHLCSAAAAHRGSRGILHPHAQNRESGGSNRRCRTE